MASYYSQSAVAELPFLATADHDSYSVNGNGERPIHGTIMIIDDVEINVKLIRAMLLEEGFETVLLETDPTNALSAIYRENPDLVLLDLIMPKVSGLEILEAIRSDEQNKCLPVLVVTGSDDHAMKTQALELGATDFLNKPVDRKDLVPRVRNSLLVKRHNDELERKVWERTRELENSRQEIIHCLARAAEYRDNETGNHVIRVGLYAGIIATALGLSDREVRTIQQAATLHDVGKIGIPDSILLKPGDLSAEEFEIMRKHCNYGTKIVSPLTVAERTGVLAHTKLGDNIMRDCNSPMLRVARVIALTHHEKWDGSGYPLGLAGTDIPLEGRITAVADVFDALSSARPYKPAFPLQKCLNILEDGRDSHFDPEILDAFLERKDEIVQIQIRHADTD